MKAVAQNSGFSQRCGHCDDLGDFRTSRVKLGVETGDLYQIGTSLKPQADRLQIIRLMQRSEWNESFKFIQYARVEPDGTCVFDTSMYYAVTDAA